MKISFNVLSLYVFPCPTKCHNIISTNAKTLFRPNRQVRSKYLAGTYTKTRVDNESMEELRSITMNPYLELAGSGHEGQSELIAGSEGNLVRVHPGQEGQTGKDR